MGTLILILYAIGVTLYALRKAGEINEKNREIYRSNIRRMIRDMQDDKD